MISPLLLGTIAMLVKFNSSNSSRKTSYSQDPKPDPDPPAKLLIKISSYSESSFSNKCLTLFIVHYEYFSLYW